MACFFLLDLARVHPETIPCHFEPFDELRAYPEPFEGINSAKNLRGPGNHEILCRPDFGGTPQNDTQWRSCNGLIGIGSAVTRRTQPSF